jgi:hypothetical protein
VIYDLGCFYARTGRSEQAIGAIRKALPRVPSLVEWSKLDPDLDALPEIPEFQAHYET